MSARLSVTVITSVETRLKAATATISVRMMNIMRFSTCTAANQVRLLPRPVAHQELAGRALRASSRGHLAARGSGPCSLQAHAGRPFERGTACAASSMCTSARPLSYS